MKLQYRPIEPSMKIPLFPWHPFSLYLPVPQAFLIERAGFFAWLLIFGTIRRFYGRFRSL
jgi:hypothetical protein